MTQIAEAFVKLRPDTTTFKAEATAGIAGGLGGIGAVGVRGAAGLGAITAAATLTTVAVKETIMQAGEFEREMDVMAVVSGATASELDAMGESAKALGADVTLPGVSAGDAAVSMNELAKAGLSVKDVMGGARGALQLAAAGEIAVKDAAALTASALNAFGLAGSEATHVADLLAGASIAAQGEVGDMALALQQSSAVARQAGLTIEQTVGAIGLLAKNGILGSDAGTSLRTTLLKLIPTTKEAAQYTRALGIEYDNNRTLGDQLPGLVEQYREALSKLPPALQQTALAQIFGTDAIRAMAIFAREGAEGLNEMTNAVDRDGAANELATARTQGFLGTLDGLKSTMETLALTIGEEMIPALTDLAEQATDATSDLIALMEAMKDLAGVEIPSWLGGEGEGDTLGKRLKEAFGEAARQVAPGVAAVKDFGKAVHEMRTDAVDDMDSLRDSMTDLRSPDVIDIAETRKAAAEGGKEVGGTFVDNTADAIIDTAYKAVQSARATLAQVVQAGKDAVAQAIAGAQQNLASLGGQLAADAGQIIDSSGFQEQIDQISKRNAAIASANQQARQREAIELARRNLEEALRDAPIQRRIEQLQEQLDARERRTSRRDVARTLRDAQEELAEARARVGSAGPLTDAQQASTARFLRPFQEAVADAKDEVGRFNTETNIDRLQAKLDGQTDDVAKNIGRLKKALQDARAALVESQRSFATEGLVSSLRASANAQKEAVTKGIQDSIQLFNDGMITLPQLNKRLAAILAENGIDYRRAGKKLGYAFARGFEETQKAIIEQAIASLAGPQDPGAGLRGTIVRPEAVQRKSAADTLAAQLAVQEAQKDFAESAAGNLALIESYMRPGGIKTRPGAATSATEAGRRGNIPP